MKGLFAGLSLLTFIELLELLVKIVIIVCCRASRKSYQQNG
jgi:hypothetical protein